jgi:hypothetical protein
MNTKIIRKISRKGMRWVVLRDYGVRNIFRTLYGDALLVVQPVSMPDAISHH